MIERYRARKAIELITMVKSLKKTYIFALEAE